MSQSTDVRPVSSAERRWWKTPLVATLVGGPCLAVQFGVYGFAGDSGVLSPVVAMLLLAIAWVLPCRDNPLHPLQSVRECAAGIGLFLAVYPVIGIGVFAAAMS
ncbi:hypothetical protein LRS74_14120 [Streptomyces sp. LX-29]|uniref:hypothetical protein n=1 Tax=Streptomyces sp. LX-29 TaxID=2900152 RepID=UPI00240DAC54|nr:hypothetical protein [Streptomyces sp. LX-29]WFB08062.1 hypothetical protein LRS74_14120 [Streptomyces sp. LX-29]